MMGTLVFKGLKQHLETQKLKELEKRILKYVYLYFQKQQKMLNLDKQLKRCFT